MADREDTKAHLQIIHTWAEFAIERNIPDMFTESHLKSILKWTADAIAVMREQEPVKPKTDGTSIYDVDGYIVCGKCGGDLGMPEVFKFCPWCGKAVKWNG